jgi:hypothetical protein
MLIAAGLFFGKLAARAFSTESEAAYTELVNRAVLQDTATATLVGNEPTINMQSRWSNSGFSPSGGMTVDQTSVYIVSGSTGKALYLARGVFSKDAWALTESSYLDLDNAESLRTMRHQLFGLSYSLHDDEEYELALGVLEAEMKLGGYSWFSPYNAACACARMGRIEEAMVWLKKAHAESNGELIHFKDDSDLDSLRSHPDFAALFGTKGGRGAGTRAEDGKTSGSSVSGPAQPAPPSGPG